MAKSNDRTEVEYENNENKYQMNNNQKRNSGAVMDGQIFDSVDFGKFLDDQLPAGLFLSKESAIPTIDSVFRSKDSFTQMFKSNDWEMSNLKREDSGSSGKPEGLTKEGAHESALTSRDWIPMDTLGSHVDVSYNRNIFSGPSISPIIAVEPSLSNKTDWDAMMLSELRIPAPAPVPASRSVAEAAAAVPALNETAVSKVGNKPPPAAGPDPPRRKRKRKPRKKVVPEVKEYVEPMELDVLCGRGGRSNHWKGNQRYREEVANLQKWYKSVEDKDEKTDLSQCLVDYVHSYNGRFLMKDSVGWYIVPNIVARRKASQALREDNDPEKRAAKRARFLKKKALEAQKALEEKKQIH